MSIKLLKFANFKHVGLIGFNQKTTIRNRYKSNRQYIHIIQDNQKWSSIQESSQNPIPKPRRKSLQMKLQPYGPMIHIVYVYANLKTSQTKTTKQLVKQ